MRVMLVEDQVLLREGLAGLFRDAGHDVVGALGDAAHLTELVAEQSRASAGPSFPDGRR
jgi:DNA-binding NarL/FixJ family response regulator